MDVYTTEDYRGYISKKRVSTSARAAYLRENSVWITKRKLKPKAHELWPYYFWVRLKVRVGYDVEAVWARAEEIKY